MKKKLSVFLFAGFLLIGMVGMASAFSIDFEDGTDGARVNDISGVTFLNYSGFAPMYLDGRTGNYNVSDINGTYNHGSYFIDGNFGMWAGPEANAQGVKIDFANNDGTFFQTGYCSYSSFFIEAYLTNGSVLTSSGGSNYGVGINYLSIDTLGGGFIDYVVLHDSGNYWVVDNITGNTTGVNAVPEPSTMMLLGLGILGFVKRKKRQ